MEVAAVLKSHDEMHMFGLSLRLLSWWVDMALTFHSQMKN